MKTLIFSVFICFIVIVPSCKAKPNTERKKQVKEQAKNDFSKYEARLGFKIESSGFNKALYDFVLDWLGTPYKYGGCTKSGTDCSCFVFNAYKEVYNKTLPRSTSEIANAAKSIKAHQLKTGDLIFFNTDGKKISHIGMHLQNDKFVHASTKRGVMISSRDEEYFQKTFRGFGSFF